MELKQVKMYEQISEKRNVQNRSSSVRWLGCLMMSRFGHKCNEMPRVEGSLKLRCVHNSLTLTGASICSSSWETFLPAPSMMISIFSYLEKDKCSSSQRCIFKWIFFVFVDFLFVYFVLVVVWGMVSPVYPWPSLDSLCIPGWVKR